MTHMQLARRIKPDYAAFKVFGITIVALVVVAIAFQVIFDQQFFYQEQVYGFNLDRPHDYSVTHVDSVWTYFCGFVAFAHILSLIWGVTNALSFRSVLGSGATRVAIWMTGMRNILTIVACLAIMIAAFAGILTMIEPHPPLTESSVGPWMVIPVAAASYLMVCALGYVVTMCFVAYHWIAGVVLVILVLLVGPRLLAPTGIQKYFTVADSGPIIAITAFLVAAIALFAAALAVAKRVAMRK